MPPVMAQRIVVRHPRCMRTRLILAACGVVIGVGSLVAGNWWTASAMALLVLGQGIAEWDSRRRGRRGDVAVQPPRPPGD